MATVQFEIAGYSLELGTRSQAIDNDRAIVPSHQLVLHGKLAGDPITVTMEFSTGIEQLSATGPTEVGHYDPTQRRAMIQAAFIDFFNTYEVVRAEKPLYCSFSHTDSDLPGSATIMSFSLTTKRSE